MVTMTTPLPAAPNRATGADTFAGDADVFTAALLVYQAQQNAQALDLNDLAGATAASAASAVNAPGTSATSSTSLAIGLGAKSLSITTGKLFAPGQTVMVAATTDPTAQMVGIITAHNSSTGAMTVTVLATRGTGTYTSWNIALSAPLPGIATVAQLLAAVALNVMINPATLFGAMQFQTLTYGSTVSWDAAQGINAGVTLAGNPLIAAPTNPQDGVSYSLKLIQDSAGLRSPSWAAAWDWGESGAPTLSAGAGKVDYVFAIYDAARGKFVASFWKAA